MKDRIKELINYENLTYSKFADIIGIQRSGVSHLINGRNNPSLDVIQKILESFDYINPEWLLLGKGSMKKYEKQGDLFSKITDKAIDESNLNEDKEIIKSKSLNYTDIDVESKKIIDSHGFNSDKKTERIVIFYSDNTFREYRESN